MPRWGDPIPENAAAIPYCYNMTDPLCEGKVQANLDTFIQWLNCMYNRFVVMKRVEWPYPMYGIFDKYTEDQTWIFPTPDYPGACIALVPKFSYTYLKVIMDALQPYSH
jgi:hypothetical protein